MAQELGGTNSFFMSHQVCHGPVLSLSQISIPINYSLVSSENLLGVGLNWVLLQGSDTCPVQPARLRVGNSNFLTQQILCIFFNVWIYCIQNIHNPRKEEGAELLFVFFYFLFSSCSRDSSICGWAVPFPPLPVCGTGDNVLAVDCISLFHYSIYSWPTRPLKQLQTASPSHFKSLGVWFRS